MNRASSYLMCTALLLSSLGCNDTISPKACGGNVEVAVLRLPNPIFTWAPACGVSSFQVVTVPASPGAMEESMWGFTVPEQSPIGPAVTYRIAPAGATVWQQPRALVAGETYRVRVMQTVGLDVVVSSGERVFTR
ncbi:MAG TPA: hypothetical protein VF836_13880 [Gemmatimonadaceae bacterium]